MPAPYQRSPRQAGWFVFVLAIFLSAFLLFQIQPLISKYILPWYGGTAAVWTTCLLVFQVLLFGGYTYVHLLSRVAPHVQPVLHLALLLGAAVISPVPTEAWKPAGDEDPLLRIVLMLLATVGVPYFALAATGPLLQSWSCRVFPDRTPYLLYALSNAGSLLALLSYPLLIEPFLTGRQQAAVWRSAFALFVVLCALAAWRARGVRGAQETAGAGEATFPPPPSLRRRMLWVGWSACGVVLFMAVTNELTLNVASVPFLWVVPLGIYLLAFIVAFSGDRAYPRRLVAVAFVLALGSIAALLELEVLYTARDSFVLPILAKIGIYALALFVLCLVCHGELYRLRPAPRHLTSFYLSIAGGGALGGIAVGVLAPRFLALNQELHVGLLACSVLYVLTRFGDPGSRLYRGRPRWAAAATLLAVSALALVLSHQTTLLLEGSVRTRRNFFGVLRVREAATSDPARHAYTLFDGGIVHGQQFVRPDLRREPTTYYSRLTGIGRVLKLRQPKGPLRVGIVGLGAGTLAAYGRAEDYFRFYEINPNVVDVARTGFTYLAETAAEWEIVLGDARLKLEEEPGQRFDVFVLDAFSSDAIPVHLLTAEAFDVYERHLAADGVVAINISNLHFELSAVVYRHADARMLHALEVRNQHRPEQLTMAAAWMFLSRDTTFMNEILWTLKPLHEAEELRLGNRPQEKHAHVRAWTDGYSSLLPILK